MRADTDNIALEPIFCESFEEVTQKKVRPLFRHYVATTQFFSRFPLLCRVPVFSNVCHGHGIYLVAALGVTYSLSKGVCAHFLSGATLPLFKDVLGLSSAEYQKYVAVCVMAWSMKPLVGVFCDSVRCFGYHKRWYLTGAASLCSCLFVCLALVSSSTSGKFGALSAGSLLFLANFCCAVLDLLPEGRYSELIKARPETSSSTVSWVWGCVMIGGCFAALVQGPLSDNHKIHYVFLLGAFFQAVIVFPLKKNWFGERRHRETQSLVLSFERRVFRESPKLVAYCLLMAVSTVSLMAVTTFCTKQTLLLTTLVVAVLLSVMSFSALPRTAALANLFMFCKELFYVQLPGPLDYFYTADETCIPGGPHFSYSYYQTFTVIVGYVAGVAGVAAFHSFFSNRSFRFTFWVTTIVKILASLVDVLIIKRWNHTVLGLDDRWSYFLGDAVVFGACQMLDFMPAVVLTSRLCPKGMEATMYAVLAGFSNLGQAMSNTVGTLLVEFVFPIQTVIPCDFSNLATLVLVGHCLLPMLVVPLTFVLIPSHSRVCDEYRECRGEPEVVPVI